MEAIGMMIFIMTIAIGSVIYVAIHDRKETKRIKQINAE